MTRSVVGSGVRVLNPEDFQQDAGDRLSIYDEANSVAALGTATIIDYTVPVGKKLSIRVGSASGENKAVFDLKVNDVTEARERSYFTEFNVKFGIEIDLAAGDNLKIVVENKRNSIADFSANISGVFTNA